MPSRFRNGHCCNRLTDLTFDGCCIKIIAIAIIVVSPLFLSLLLSFLLPLILFMTLFCYWLCCVVSYLFYCNFSFKVIVVFVSVVIVNRFFHSAWTQLVEKRQQIIQQWEKEMPYSAMPIFLQCFFNELKRDDNWSLIEFLKKGVYYAFIYFINYSFICYKYLSNHYLLPINRNL